MTTATQIRTAHDTIILERTYDASPARVFAAWESVEARLRWSVPLETAGAAYDKSAFNVGGHEHQHFRPEGSPFMLSNDALYLDIVKGRRIALAYTMAMDGKPTSHSLAVTEFFPDGAEGCRLVFTEQGAYYGGEDDVTNRRIGTEDLLGKLADELSSHA